MEKININELTKEEKLIVYKCNNDIYKIVYNYDDLYKYFDNPKNEFLKFLNLLNKESTKRDFWNYIYKNCCGRRNKKLPKKFIRDFYYDIYYTELESIAYHPNINTIEYYKQCLKEQHEKLNRNFSVKDDNNYDLFLANFVVIIIIFILLF